jgi:nitrate reductase delta subunit
MTRTLRALSALLSYPTAEMKAAAGEIGQAFREEGLLPDDALRALGPLLAGIEAASLMDLEERYVALFDRSRTLSLNLFEHLHGESRDRGGAMVDLLAMYRAGGYEPAGADLPDHLPILLEFLSTRPLGEARATLAEAAHILEALRIRLARRDAGYAALLGAVLAVAASRGDRAAAAALAAAPDDDPDDLAALDAVWEEAAVTFGPDPSAGCPVSRELLARMDLPKQQPPAWAGAAE